MALNWENPPPFYFAECVMVSHNAAKLKSRNESRDAECVQQFLRNILCKEDQL